jgi:hypothetical protein
MLKNPLFKFLSSLKLAVLVLLSLAGVLATATVLESEYGTRAAYVMVYGTPWFYLLLFLLGTNVLCAALSRLPWKKRHIGFVVTHAGIITILVGSYLTMALGVDGSLPVYEGSEDSEVILTRLKLSVTDEEERLAQHFPVPEFAMREQGKLMSVALSPTDSLVIEEFIPRAVAERKIIPSPVSGVGMPALRVEVFNKRFRVGEWLMLSQAEKPQEMSLGPAKLSLRKLWSKDAESRFLDEKGGAKQVAKKGIGYLVVMMQGKQYRVEVDASLDVMAARYRAAWKSMRR